MTERETDSVDVLTAFAIGALIGVGATLLLRSDPPSPRERALQELRPIARKARRAAARAKKQYGKSYRAGKAATAGLGSAGKEVVDDLQDQIEQVLAAARDEINATARKQLKAARKKLRNLRG